MNAQQATLTPSTSNKKFQQYNQQTGSKRETIEPMALVNFSNIFYIRIHEFTDVQMAGALSYMIFESLFARTRRTTFTLL